MNSKSLVGLLMILFVSTSSIAQRVCGASENFSNQLIRDSTFRDNRRIIEGQTERFLMNSSNKRFLAVTTVIPVVIHVVYNTDIQKIGMDQVASQIKVLNEDFASKNADLAQVPPVFKNLIAADQGIQFQLAVRDPNGNQTNGVVYAKTNATSFNGNDAIKYTALGGSNAWPTSEYLNIWVGNLSGGLLGYAQFPGGPPATDGVVVAYTAFGTTGTAAYPFNKGRTATHEIGHWLDLFHIWGDDGNACTGSDRISDTPNQAGSNINCPAFPHATCNNGPNGDLFMNYMDYVDDRCMVMFTNEQAMRMRSTLQNVRKDLYISSGLIEASKKLQRNGSLLLHSYDK
jgi:hypothetical protein